MNASSDLLNQLRIERQSTPPPRRRLPWILAGLAVAAVTVAGYFFLAGKRAVEVQVATARMPTHANGGASVLDASGYVTARRQATVSAKITGKVSEVLIEEGMRVEQDQVLARLDDTDARAQRDLAQAQRDAARAQLSEISAQLTQAEADFTRQRELAQRHLAAAAALDAARAQRDTLRARLASARQQIAVAEKSLALAEIGLDNTIVRAPFAGVIVAKAAQPGEIISPISAGGGFTRTGIGTVVDMDSLEVQVDVNESFIGRVQPGQPVEAVLNAYPDWRIPGSVIAIIPTADRSKATVKVRIALATKEPRIVPDMGVRVSFLGARTPPAAEPIAGVLVPAAAVQGSADRGVVFVAKDQTVERREVSLGPVQDNERLITQGLRAGEKVVVSPPARLSDGDRIKSR